MDPEAQSAKLPSAEHVAVVEEVDLINRAAEEQLTAISALNTSLAKTVIKKEAETTVLQDDNEALENVNEEMSRQLEDAQQGVRDLFLKEEQLENVEKKYNETVFAAGNAQLVADKREQQIGSIRSERDALDDEVSTLRSQIDYLQRKLNSTFDKIEQNKSKREADVQQRSVQIDTILKQKEDAKQTKGMLQHEIESRDRQVDDLNLQLKDAIQGQKQITEVGDMKVHKAEEQLDNLKHDLDQTTNDLAVLRQQRDSSRATSRKLESAVTALTGERAQLEKLAVMSNHKLQTAKNALLEVQKQIDETKHALDIKLDETNGLNVDADRLKIELQELGRRYNALEQRRRVVKNDAEAARNQLDLQQSTLVAVEKEKDKLVGEKDSLDRGTADERNRYAFIEREKADLEKLAKEMEYNRMNLLAKAQALEQEKHSLKAQAEKEYHQLMAAKEAELVREQAEIRNKVDTIVGGRALEHKAAAEREELTASQIQPANIDVMRPRVVEANLMPPNTVMETNVLDDGKNSGGATIPIISPHKQLGLSESSVTNPSAENTEAQFYDAREELTPSTVGTSPDYGHAHTSAPTPDKASSSVSDYGSSVSGSQGTPQANTYTPPGRAADTRMHRFPQATSKHSKSGLVDKIKGLFKKNDE